MAKVRKRPRQQGLCDLIYHAHHSDRNRHLGDRRLLLEQYNYDCKELLTQKLPYRSCHCDCLQSDRSGGPSCLQDWQRLGGTEELIALLCHETNEQHRHATIKIMGTNQNLSDMENPFSYYSHLNQTTYQELWWT